MRELIKQAIIYKLFSNGDPELEEKLKKWDQKVIEAGKPAKNYRRGGAAIGATLGALKGGKKTALMKRLMNTAVGGGTGFLAGAITGRIVKRKEIGKGLKKADKYFMKEVAPLLDKSRKRKRK